MPGSNLLSELPEELLQDVLERLQKADLTSLNLVSRWCYEVATPLVWRQVELVDCGTEHGDGRDEHDDGGIVRKLLLLARRPNLARSVHVLTHRCHLPPPAIFSELPYNTFSAQTLSTDPRTIRLVQHAVALMTHVHTLRIIFGHPNLTDALLRCFFDTNRALPGSGYNPIRKLWLENCRISAGLNPSIESHPYGLPLQLDFTGLESVRFRRLPMRPVMALDWFRATIVYSRGGRFRKLLDGTGGRYDTTLNGFEVESRDGDEHLLWLENRRVYHSPDGEAVSDLGPSPLEALYEQASRWDDMIYESLPTTGDLSLPSDVEELGFLSLHDRSVMAYRGQSIDCGPPDSSETENAYPTMRRDNLLTRTRAYKAMQRETIPSSTAAIMMLRSAGSTLTSLTLDWVLSIPPLSWSPIATNRYLGWLSMYQNLFGCRFPHLRAFQFRNSVVPDTLLLPGFYLFDRSFRTTRETLGLPAWAREDKDDPEMLSLELAGLEFMEAHPKLQCLAWPMDHFFAPGEMDSEIATRVQAVVENLGRTLTDLRVDSLYSGTGEPQSEAWVCHDYGARASRRKFITEFATKMQKIESIKIEGGMPRDERREVVRALHNNPLNKIVMIGVCSPLGNTWGYEGADVSQSLVVDSELDGLEAEDKPTIFELGPTKPNPPPLDFKYDLEYGWEGSAPMLHTIASYHASTIRELKFCGYKGAPVLLSPTPITNPLLAPLKHFHALESIILSMHLTTLFEGASRDNEVISYWLNSRTPTSTALVHITDEEPEGWEKELRTKFAPDALAWRITNFVAPFLSERAKGRKGGVHVRASFCIGENGGLFDVDLWVGKGVLGSDVCLGFKGPREELEEERRRGKLEGRRWF
ncbi:hypothetical protein PRZ48_013663 [Zasmidium cellare]|uniref:F-box domain-containing protein n=1 Tax=Zasmidium cellare TaxID=395010 RepID=A0ABR0E1Q0_ZASCE|nr:hypothetical protein PRZ48_013663 [Zasmidium cellare]